MSAFALKVAISPARPMWIFPAAVFLGVLVAQLVLVRVAGTDIPFHDQWGIEGSWLYPTWLEGRLQVADMLQPFNEHRIVWTHLLNLSLFVVNGQWDPLVQLVAIAGLRAACAAGVAWLFIAGLSPRDRLPASAAVALAFLPVLAWHNVLWGIESHAYFAIGLSLLTLAWLGLAKRTPGQTWAGLIAGTAALLAMGPGALAPLAVLGLVALRVAESRRMEKIGRRFMKLADAGVGGAGVVFARDRAGTRHVALDDRLAIFGGGRSGAGLASCRTTAGGDSDEPAAVARRGGPRLSVSDGHPGRGFCRVGGRLECGDRIVDGFGAWWQRRIVSRRAVALRGFSCVAPAGERLVRGGAHPGTGDSLARERTNPRGDVGAVLDRGMAGAFE